MASGDFRPHGGVRVTLVFEGHASLPPLTLDSRRGFDIGDTLEDVGFPGWRVADVRGGAGDSALTLVCEPVSRGR